MPIFFVAWSARACALVALLIAITAGGRQARADEQAEGRRHAQKASNLAASGKCKQALPEYDQAIALLRDPALLFNRAECHRKLGETAEALEDYNQFLAMRASTMARLGAGR